MFLYSTVSTLKPISCEKIKLSTGSHVPTNRRNRSHNLAELELVKDSSFTGGVETNLHKRVNKTVRGKGYCPSVPSKYLEKMATSMGEWSAC